MGAEDNFVPTGYNAFSCLRDIRRGISKSIFSLCFKSVALEKVLLHSKVVILIYIFWFYTSAMEINISKIKFFQCNVKDSAHLQCLLIMSPALLWSSLLWHHKLSLFPLVFQSSPCVVIYRAFYSASVADTHTQKFCTVFYFEEVQHPLQHPTTPSPPVEPPNVQLRQSASAFPQNSVLLPSGTQNSSYSGSCPHCQSSPLQRKQELYSPECPETMGTPEWNVQPMGRGSGQHLTLFHSIFMLELYACIKRKHTHIVYTFALCDCTANTRLALAGFFLSLLLTTFLLQEKVSLQK